MKPLLLMFPPTNEFDSGIKTYCRNLEKIYDCKSKVVIYKEIDFRKEDYDFTIIVGYTKAYDDLSILDKLPKPILMVSHDTQLYSYVGDIVNKVDGFIVSMEENRQFIQRRQRIPIVKIRQPFVPEPIPSHCIRLNQVVSIGRITPDRGHRHSAELGDLGHRVVIAGSHVKHHEYNEYYKRVEQHHNVIMKPDPTDEELIEILAESKVIMSFYYVQEKYPSVYYALLEPISMGCVPVVPYWVAQNCIRSGLKVYVADSAVDANAIVTRLFDNKKDYETVAKMNREIVEHWSDNYKTELKYFIKENF